MTTTTTLPEAATTQKQRHYWVDPRRNETADPCDECGHYGWQQVPGCDCCDLTPAQRRQRKGKGR